MTATPAPVPRRRSLAPGILLGVLGVVLLLIAGIIFAVSQIGARISSSSSIEMPEALQLELDAGDYEIYLTDDSIRDVSDPVSAIVCDVEVGGAVHQVRGSDQALISSEVDGDELIGGFTTTGGPTTVTCDFADAHASTDYFYRVQPSSPAVSVTAFVLLLLGLAALGAAALLIVVRVRARR